MLSKGVNCTFWVVQGPPCISFIILPGGRGDFSGLPEKFWMCFVSGASRVAGQVILVSVAKVSWFSMDVIYLSFLP